MERRKLNNADLEKYGSYENFCKLQDEYLDKREALGHDVRSFQDRMEEMTNVGKKFEDKKGYVYDKNLNMIRKLAFKWSTYSYFSSTGLYTHADLIQEASIAWHKAYDTYHAKGYPDGQAKFSTYAYACIKNRFKDMLIALERQEKYGEGGVFETTYIEDNVNEIDLMYDNINTHLTLPEWEEKSDVVRMIRSVLTERDGNILMMKYGIGLGSPSNTYEIAELLDIPRMTVQDALKRATSNEQLKQLLIKFI